MAVVKWKLTESNSSGRYSPNQKRYIPSMSNLYMEQAVKFFSPVCVSGTPLFIEPMPNGVETRIPRHAA